MQVLVLRYHCHCCTRCRTWLSLQPSIVIIGLKVDHRLIFLNLREWQSLCVWLLLKLQSGCVDVSMAWMCSCRAEQILNWTPTTSTKWMSYLIFSPDTVQTWPRLTTSVQSWFMWMYNGMQTHVLLHIWSLLFKADNQKCFLAIEFSFSMS